MTTREYKILGAASARSTEIELTEQALSDHSLRTVKWSTLRTIQSLTAEGLNAMGVSNLSTHLFFSNV
ncbi:hypothetical protein GN286_15940 [Rhodobacteraceae bacterium IMCC15231]|nr:hypothetical protein [Rhodobacteraceae bacterium IMCC15231]